MIKNTDFTKTTSHGRYAHMDINKEFKSVSTCADFKI